MNFVILFFSLMWSTAHACCGCCCRDSDTNQGKPKGTSIIHVAPALQSMDGDPAKSDDANSQLSLPPSLPQSYVSPNASQSALDSISFGNSLRSSRTADTWIEVAPSSHLEEKGRKSTDIDAVAQACQDFGGPQGQDPMGASVAGGSTPLGLPEGLSNVFGSFSQP